MFLVAIFEQLPTRMINLCIFLSWVTVSMLQRIVVMENFLLVNVHVWKSFKISCIWCCQFRFAIDNRFVKRWLSLGILEWIVNCQTGCMFLPKVLDESLVELSKVLKKLDIFQSLGGVICNMLCVFMGSRSFPTLQTM